VGDEVQQRALRLASSASMVSLMTTLWSVIGNPADRVISVRCGL
jgi:hypothetical protein